MREEHRAIPIDEARNMGAMALFGEKYGDRVRVIKYGNSVELCGGTHVDNTGNIGMIKIVSESSIAAGIRRIEAVTGENVENMLDTIEDLVRDIKALFNNTPDVITAIKKSMAENTALQKQVDTFVKDRVKMLKEKLYTVARDVNGVTLLELRGKFPADIVKTLAMSVKADNKSATVFLAATEDNGKPMLTVTLSDDVVKDGKNAGAIVREAAKLIQGGGGGQPGFAQAGGRNADGLEAAFDKMVELLYQIEGVICYHWHEALPVALLITAILYPIILWGKERAPLLLGKKRT